MPAKAGIHVNPRCKFQQRLDSDMRRKDGNRSRLPLDKFKTSRLRAEGCLVAHLAQTDAPAKLLIEEVSSEDRKGAGVEP